MKGFKAKDLPIKHEYSERNSYQYSIKVARSVEEVEKLRYTWEKWQRHPNSDIDHYLTVINSREEVIRPHVIILSKREEIRTLLIGRIEDVPIEIKFGYKVLFRPKVRSLHILYEGLLGDSSFSSCEALVSELMQTLSRKEADVVFFHFIRRDSYIYKLTTTRPHFLARNHCITPIPHFRLSLPKTYNKYLCRFSKKRRADFRKYNNRLSKRYGASFFIRSSCEATDLDSILRDTEAIASKTYQRGLGAGFIDNDETRRRFRLAAERGWLQTYLLYIENKPVAFFHGFVYGNTLFLDSTGYDPEYQYYRPGTVLLLKLIQKMCEDGVVNSIDFGFGEAYYKRVFCNEEWVESSIFIFDLRIKTIAINALWTITVIVSKFAKKILQHMNMTAKIKKIWRSRLSKSIKGDNENP